MRSSDWSSDVCSSDLLTGGQEKMAGIRPPQAYLALDMTDTAPLASLSADLTGGRTSGLRFLDDAGTLAIVLAVTGLAEAERQPPEDRRRAALLAREGVTSVRVALTEETKTRTIIAVGGGKRGIGIYNIPHHPDTEKMSITVQRR